MEYGLPLAGLLIGGVLGWLIGLLLQQKSSRQHQNQLNILDKEKSLLQDRLQTQNQQLKKLQEENQALQFSETDLRSSLIQAQSENRFLQEKLQTQKEELQKLQKQLTDQFENLANQILDRNREQLAVSNQEKLKLILDPLKEKINSFEKRVEETYKNQSVESGVLKAEIEKLAHLNQQMSEEARNLTIALKGDNKTQGNWGELVLERILESSGLTKGVEYVLQGEELRLRNDDGNLQKPDAIVHLPEGKHLIIDAKVSLKAYEAYLSCTDETEKTQHLRSHVFSIKNHVKGLADKHYHTLKKLHTPEFVLLFLPIEASFSLALSADNNELFSYAWKRKVVIVSPTTLMATLRTTASIWKYEKQNKNALQIAEESGKLYDKLFGFVSELEKVGKYLQQSQITYQEAMKKLLTGRGNLLDRAEKLKSMGISAKKDMDQLEWVKDQQTGND